MTKMVAMGGRNGGLFGWELDESTMNDALE
jgi:hypothetical protein